jgi:hypothetical protein
MRRRRVSVERERRLVTRLRVDRICNFLVFRGFRFRLCVRALRFIGPPQSGGPFGLGDLYEQIDLIQRGKLIVVCPHE